MKREELEVRRQSVLIEPDISAGHYQTVSPCRSDESRLSVENEGDCEAGRGFER